MTPPTTAQQIAASQTTPIDKKAVAVKADAARPAGTGTTAQPGRRVVSGGQATKQPAAQTLHTRGPPQAVATATSSRAPTQLASAPRAAAGQSRSEQPAASGGTTKLPLHPARPSTPAPPAQGASSQRTSSPTNGRTSTTSTPSKSDKPQGSDEDPRDLVPPSAPQVKEGNGRNFWYLDQHDWQKGSLPIKNGSLFSK